MARYGSAQRLRCTQALVSNFAAFARLLESCIKLESLEGGCHLHACIIKSQFWSGIFVHNRLIELYGRCGRVGSVRKLFDEMPQRNTFTWNIVINALCSWVFMEEAKQLFYEIPEPDQCSWNLMVSGFSQHGLYSEALAFFCRMHRENFAVSSYAFSTALSACARETNLSLGVQIHCSILKSPISSDVHMGSALIDMYSKCGSTIHAQLIFVRMPDRNVVSWNSLISCYEQNGPVDNSLKLFDAMMEHQVKPDEMTFSSVISACATLSAINLGLQIHTCVVKSGRCTDDLVLSNAIVDMYAKCRRMKEAKWVFDHMPIRNVVSGTSLVSGYARSSNLVEAKLMFAKMNEKNVVSWNALISGYGQNGEIEEAFHLFSQMKRESFCPTHYTFGILLSSCANVADLYLGRQLHTHVLKHGFRFQTGLESDIFVGNSLVDMYNKCGSTEDGLRVFNSMAERDNVSWNALILGYAQNGYASEALAQFRRMLSLAVEPDHVTLIGVLCACSHAGMVEEGRTYFRLMAEEYGILPTKDHYTCMVDLLGRAGCISDALMFINSMPIEPDCVLWGSLLGACKVHHNIGIGNLVAEKMIQLDSKSSAPYVLLSNMYAELNRWEDAVRARKMMRQRGIVKQPGYSWVEIGGKIHIFTAKDKRHPQRCMIRRILRFLTTQLKHDKCDSFIFLEHEISSSDQLCKTDVLTFETL